MSAFRAIVPSPLTSAVLLVLWLSLARTASAGQILLGIAIALAVPHASSALRPEASRMRRPAVFVRFVFSVLRDVVVSSCEVAWGVLVWRWRRANSRFVVIPLDLRDPRGLAALAMVTTAVPGTVWSELALDRSAMMLHVWDVDEESAFIARYKARYEQPLREIFE